MRSTSAESNEQITKLIAKFEAIATLLSTLTPFVTNLVATLDAITITFQGSTATISIKELSVYRNTLVSVSERFSPSWLSDFITEATSGELNAEQLENNYSSGEDIYQGLVFIKDRVDAMAPLVEYFDAKYNGLSEASN